MKRESKRVVVDVILFLLIMVLFGSDMYQNLVAPLQLFSLKMMLASAGLLHAHIFRKRSFPSVDWKAQPTGGTYVAIALYIVIPICYAFGG